MLNPHPASKPELRPVLEITAAGRAAMAEYDAMLAKRRGGDWPDAMHNRGSR